MSFGAEVRRRLQLAVLGSALVLAVLLVLVAVEAGVVLDADRWIGEPLAGLAADHPWLEDVAHVVAQVTRPIWLNVVAVAVAMLLVVRGFRRPATWLVLVMTGCWTSTLLLKWLVGRARPEYALDSLPDGSFPSGHSSAIACAAGVTLVLATLFVRRRSQRRMVAVLVTSVAVLVGVDRLLLGVHWPSDVVGGFALGALWVLLAAAYADPTPRPASVAPMPSARPGTRRLAVILNPIKVEDPAAFRALVDRRAGELGWSEPVWFETTVEDPGRSMAHAAAVADAELVVVCGGDGTVRTVCAELAGTGIPVGVVPAGTGNLLARNLALPLYLNAAVEVALNGQDRAIDIVRVAGDGLEPDEHFLVMAGMGFDAAIMEGANEQIKAKVGWLAYVVAGMRNLMFPAVRVDISLDDEPFTRHRARTIVVGNVGFLQAGLPLLPDATIDDGRIDVVLVNPARFLSWLRVVVRIVGRRKKVDGTVNRMTGRKVVIKAAHDTPRQIDGDAIGAGTELICECLPGRLLVRVPR
ncbi:phosphatase PAP2 family protein [Nocardioides sp. HDW12B]|uniref:diacylglycerol kinase family protein n=1 Tax=Nocardioides sp. HDW12B TaxID=2714939 RepID=UPI00140E7CF1|nr:diacylglycerol kinase family protein [Nocardioides sp. HDW12B]QIK68072.1 phosphatase PAP2 family protein [Nocardioides sp. HDW12B]